MSVTKQEEFHLTECNSATQRCVAKHRSDRLKTLRIGDCNPNPHQDPHILLHSLRDHYKNPKCKKLDNNFFSKNWIVEGNERWKRTLPCLPDMAAADDGAGGVTNRAHKRKQRKRESHENDNRGSLGQVDGLGEHKQRGKNPPDERRSGRKTIETSAGPALVRLWPLAKSLTKVLRTFTFLRDFASVCRAVALRGRFLPTGMGGYGDEGMRILCRWLPMKR